MIVGCDSFVVCTMHLTTFLGCSASSLYSYYIAFVCIGLGEDGSCMYNQFNNGSPSVFHLYGQNLVLRRSFFCASFALSAKACSLLNKYNYLGWYLDDVFSLSSH
jgi:hypothetical protein